MEKRGIFIKLLFCSIVILLVVSCGSQENGAGAPNTLSLRIDGGPELVYTEQPDSFDPLISGVVDGLGGVNILMDAGWNGSSYNVNLWMILSDAVPGTYTTPEIYVVYSDGTTDYTTLVTGSVTLDTVGNVGERITGTYILTIDDALSSQVTISGSFSVTRDPVMTTTPP